MDVYYLFFIMGASPCFFISNMSNKVLTCLEKKSLSLSNCAGYVARTSLKCVENLCSIKVEKNRKRSWGGDRDLEKSMGKGLSSGREWRMDSSVKFCYSFLYVIEFSRVVFPPRPLLHFQHNCVCLINKCFLHFTQHI